MHGMTFHVHAPPRHTACTPVVKPQGTPYSQVCLSVMHGSPALGSTDGHPEGNAAQIHRGCPVHEPLWSHAEQAQRRLAEYPQRAPRSVHEVAPGAVGGQSGRFPHGDEEICHTEPTHDA
jgi:hypothetical protein